MSPILQVILAVFGVMDPVGNVPVFLALTDAMPKEKQRQIATSAILRAACILVIFVFFGRAVLDAFHISLESFRIAGGIILTLLGLQIVFDISLHRGLEAEQDISIVPLATPLIAGPGMITSAVILAREYGTVATLVGIAANLLLSKLLFHYAHLVVKLLGRKGTMAFAKVMGLIVTAIGVEFIRSVIT